MSVDQPGLHDVPHPEQTATPQRPQRGKNRETWARTTTVDVTIVDAEAIHQAIALAEQGAVAIALRGDSCADDGESEANPDVEDAEPEADPQAPTDACEALAWLIWPTAGLERALEAAAFRILSVDSAVVAGSRERATITWSVTVKLTDVDALRRLAVQSHPEAADLIAQSLAVAWQHAADLFAPVRELPGTAWRSGQVDVQHLPSRRQSQSPEPVRF